MGGEKAVSQGHFWREGNFKLFQGCGVYRQVDEIGQTERRSCFYSFDMFDYLLSRVVGLKLNLVCHIDWIAEFFLEFPVGILITTDCGPI